LLLIAAVKFEPTNNTHQRNRATALIIN